MKQYIVDLKAHEPRSILSQNKVTDWLSYFHLKDLSPQIQKYAVSEKYIQTRGIYSSGIGIYEKNESELYQLLSDDNPSLEKRSLLAQRLLEEAISEMYRKDEIGPDYLNHISCTHYQSPSIAQKLVAGKEWGRKTQVTHLYHMGCYAALPALRVSSAYLKAGAKTVGNIHTELCSFHLDRGHNTPEDIITQTLFADGIVRYSVVREEVFFQKKEGERIGLELMALKEELISGTEDEMTWSLTGTAFSMTLTKRVPVAIARNIEQFACDLFSMCGLTFEKEKDQCLFAIHPGGPKIIQLIQKTLKLRDDQVDDSAFILKTRGNMSSATLPHIWEKMLHKKENNGQYLFTVAFGPGLTMTGALCRLWNR